MNDEFYISLAGEIFDGYSEFEFGGRSLYLKHLSIKDQRNISVYYEKHKKSAIKRGVSTEEEILAKVKDDGLWSDEDDLKISSISLEIENLKKTKKSFFLKSQRDNVQKTIDEKEKDYYTLSVKRKEIVGKTAEDYASNMAAIEMIRYFVFDSPELNNQAFTEEDFDEMEDFEIIKLRKFQDEVSERMSELKIQETVLRPFFSLYLSFCDNARDFFGKPLIDLTVYQLKMVVFGRVFHSIFQYVEDIPEHIREDPEKLLAFSEAKQNKAKGKGKSFIDDDAAGSTVFGGTSEDIKDLNTSGERTVSLSEEIKKAGGKLNMEQMMKLAGQ